MASLQSCLEIDCGWQVPLNQLDAWWVFTGTLGNGRCAGVGGLLADQDGYDVAALGAELPEQHRGFRP